MGEDFFQRLSGEGEPAPRGADLPLATSFAVRTRIFWDWFVGREEELYRSLQEGKLDPDALSQAIDSLSPELAWELCPCEEDGREGFALSGSSDGSLRLLAKYAISKAPATKRWKLFSSKQPSVGMLTTSIDGMDIEFDDYRFALRFDEKDERLEVSVHHPRFAKLDQGVCMQAVFIVLDNALGENFVEAYVGPIDIAKQLDDEHKHTVQDLRSQARAAVRLHDQDPDVDPSDRWYTYSRKELGDPERIPRSDILGGNTCHIQLIQDLDTPDREDPLAGSGATLAYLRFPSHTLTPGSEVNERGEIEDALVQALDQTSSAHFLGGAHGQKYAYIDWILFDEELAIQSMQQTLAHLDRVESADLRFFAPTRAHDRAVLKQKS